MWNSPASGSSRALPAKIIKRTQEEQRQQVPPRPRVTDVVNYKAMPDGPAVLLVNDEEAVATCQPEVHTQLGRAAIRILAANERMNQAIFEHFDPTARRAKAPVQYRAAFSGIVRD